jgi:hypothetical protein
MYAIYHRSDRKGGQRMARRFLPGHGRHRVANADRIARVIGDHTEQLGSGHDATSFEADFSDEYLGEAWLALAEGGQPLERVKQQKRADGRSIRTVNIDTVLKHPGICEQVCVTDPEPED